MSIIGFATVVSRLPRVVYNHGLKRGLYKYGVKQSIKHVGVVPATAGLVAAPIAAAALPLVPGAAEVTALAVAAGTRTAMKAPKAIGKVLKSCDSVTLPKDMSIFTMK